MLINTMLQFIKIFIKLNKIMHILLNNEIIIKMNIDLLIINMTIIIILLLLSNLINMIMKLI